MSKPKKSEIDQTAIVLTLAFQGKNYDIVLEPNKAYYIGRIDKEREDVSSTGIYLFDEEGNIYEYFGESLAVSRRHAKITVKDGKILIEDYGPNGEGSKNGIKVNGVELKPRQPHELKENDVFSLGKHNEFRVIKIVSVSQTPVEEKKEGEPTRFELVSPEETVLKPAENSVKKQIGKEVETIVKSLAEAVNPVNQKEVAEHKEILDEVQEVGANIEKEVIESLVPVLTKMKFSMRAPVSASWYKFLRKVNHTIKERSIIPSMERTSEAILELKDELKRTVLESLKNTSFYVEGNAETIQELLNLSEKDLEKLADAVTNKLLKDKQFASLTYSGVTSIRYGLATLHDRKNIYLSYRHAIRLNGYVASVLLEELSDRISINREFLREFKTKLTLKSLRETKRIEEEFKPAKEVPAWRKAKVEPEEELVSQ